MSCSREGGQVLGLGAVGQDAGVQSRVQRLHATVEHLGKARDVGDFEVRDAGVAQRLGRAAGGDQFDADRGAVPSASSTSPVLSQTLSSALTYSSSVPATDDGLSALAHCRHHPTDHQRVQLALDQLDALVQRLFGVVGLDRHAALGEDRTVVERLGRDVHRAPGLG